MPKTFLIVEDNDLNMKLFGDLLQAHGFNTLQTVDDQNVVSIAHDKKPDLILMDIQLTGISGLEITKMKQVVGKNVKTLMPAPCNEEHDGYLANYLKSGKAKIIGIGREVDSHRKGGTVFPFDLAVSGMRIGKQRKFVGIGRDMTERKRAEDLIAQQSQVLLELSTPVIQVWDGIVLLPLVGVESALNLDQAMDRVERMIVRRMDTEDEEVE